MILETSIKGTARVSSTERDSQPSQSLGDQDAPPIAYRCVCGQVISMDPTGGGACGACGRKYDSSVLRGVDTTSFSDSIAPLPVVARADEHCEGQRFGHYLIVGRLGKGGMGEVFQALDESLQRYVAVKVLRGQASPISKRSSFEVISPPPVRTDPKKLDPALSDPGKTISGGNSDKLTTEGLLQEAVAQARLNHPHVVHIYYVGHEGDTPFLAMELVGKSTLADRVKQGPMPFGQVTSIALQIISALQHAGSFDIVHGDIKPSNLLMSDRRTVKLSDFGLARRLSKGDEESQLVNGSPNYISPEASRGEHTDIRSDMYSLGVLLFEMTFGRLPYSFEGSGIVERLKAHQSAAVEFPTNWPRNVPRAWRRVLEKLLAKSPQGRYQYYRQLQDDVVRLNPVSLPRAAKLRRLVAWLVDIGLVIGCQQLLMNSSVFLFGVRAPLPTEWAMLCLPPLLFCLLQFCWTTPGKFLFQFRVVNQQGMRPGPWSRLGRAFWQLWPVWGFTALSAFSLLGWDRTWLQIPAILFAVPIVADLLTGIISRRGRTLHDLTFDTQVVLDLPAYDSGEAEEQRQQEEEQYWERKYWSPLKREVRRLRKKHQH